MPVHQHAGLVNQIRLERLLHPLLAMERRRLKALPLFKQQAGGQ